jgi:hypothetical protein
MALEPSRFRAYLVAEMGERAAELATVSPGEDKGGSPAKGEEPCSPGEQGSGRRCRGVGCWSGASRPLASKTPFREASSGVP